MLVSAKTLHALIINLILTFWKLLLVIHDTVSIFSYLWEFRKSCQFQPTLYIFFILNLSLTLRNCFSLQQLQQKPPRDVFQANTYYLFNQLILPHALLLISFKYFFIFHHLYIFSKDTPYSFLSFREAYSTATQSWPFITKWSSQRYPCS